MAYNLIQDAFNDGLIEKIRLTAYLKNADGEYVTDGSGNKVPLDNLSFACCTRREFVSEVQTRLTQPQKFPFIFIESGDNISYESEINGRTVVAIGEVFLCTLSNQKLLADERDKISFNTILFPLKESFEQNLKQGPLMMRNTKDQSFKFNQYHSYVTSESRFEEKLDVIILQDLELILTTKC